MTLVVRFAPCCSAFQLTSSQGGWLSYVFLLPVGGNFQLTSSQGGWRNPHCHFVVQFPFNSHPHKEDDLRLTGFGYLLVSFNSHPHKEDDIRYLMVPLLCSLSTHILTRRMTSEFLFIQSNYTLSTHILTRRMTFPNESESSPAIFQLTSSQGGWRTKTFQTNWSFFFQLTSSQGGWLHMGKDDKTLIHLSTHILTRRMTEQVLLKHIVYTFQLTSSQGGWQQ